MPGSGEWRSQDKGRRGTAVKQPPGRNGEGRAKGPVSTAAVVWLRLRDETWARWSRSPHDHSAKKPRTLHVLYLHSEDAARLDRVQPYTSWLVSNVTACLISHTCDAVSPAHGGFSGSNGLRRDVCATTLLHRSRKKAIGSRVRGMMLGVVEAQGRRFRLRREPMVKVKQVALPILALSLSRSLLVISRQLMLSTLDVSAVDVRLETPIDEAEARLGGVSQIVGHKPLSHSSPFRYRLGASWRGNSSFTR